MGKEEVDLTLLCGFKFQVGQKARQVGSKRVGNQVTEMIDRGLKKRKERSWE
jgi:hypothetical protein